MGHGWRSQRTRPEPDPKEQEDLGDGGPVWRGQAERVDRECQHLFLPLTRPWRMALFQDTWSAPAQENTAHPAPFGVASHGVPEEGEGAVGSLRSVVAGSPGTGASPLARVPASCLTRLRSILRVQELAWIIPLDTEVQTQGGHGGDHEMRGGERGSKLPPSVPDKSGGKIGFSCL